MAVPSAVAGLLRRPARLGDEVYSAMFAQIMSLDIAPGARISIDAVARTLGVSQTPVREALARLESEGLVSKMPLVGYSAAAQLTAKQLTDLYDMRILIEPFAARRCAELASNAVIAYLEQLCGEMDALADQDGLPAYAQFAQLDMALHDQVAVTAGNEQLIAALSRLHTHVHLFRLVSQGSETADAKTEHGALLAAIRKRDGVAAEQAMRLHVERSRDRFVQRRG